MCTCVRWQHAIQRASLRVGVAYGFARPTDGDVAHASDSSRIRSRKNNSWKNLSILSKRFCSPIRLKRILSPSRVHILSLSGSALTIQNVREKMIYHEKKSYKEVDCSIESFLMREASSRKIKEARGTSRKLRGQIHRSLHRRFFVRIKLTAGIESAVKSPRWGGEGGCIRHVPRLCAAGKQIRRVHGRHGMYKAGVVRRVNNGRRGKKTRAFGRQTRAVLKRGFAIYGADLFAREQKPGQFQSRKSLRHAPDGRRPRRE